jgi:hypothetical protein
MKGDYTFMTDQEKVTELGKIINQIFNFIRETASLLKQALGGITVIFGYEDPALYEPLYED